VRRALKGDGIIAEKAAREGESSEITPEDVAGIKAFVETNRKPAAPFDIVLVGNTGGMTEDAVRLKLTALRDSGATWWVEGCWDKSEKQTLERIRQGPPRNDE
jgi:hypothetical protein